MLSTMVSKYQFTPLMALLEGDLGSGKTLAGVALSHLLAIKASEEETPVHLVTNLASMCDHWTYGNTFVHKTPQDLRQVVLGSKAEIISPCIILIDEIQIWASTLNPRSPGVKSIYEMGTQQRKVFATTILTAPRAKRVSGMLRADLPLITIHVGLDKINDRLGFAPDRGKGLMVQKAIERFGNLYDTFERQA